MPKSNLLHSVFISFLQLAFLGLLFPKTFSSVLLGVLIVTSFVINILQKEIQKPNREQWFFAGFFFLYAIAIFYSEDKSYGSKILERNISWLFIPLIIPLVLINSFKNLFKPLITFSISVHVLIFGLFLIAITRFLSSKDYLVFYYTELTDVISFHPVYLAVYFLFAVMVLIETWRLKIIIIPNYLKVIILVFDMLMLILLSSKIVLASLVFVMFIFVMKSYKNKKKILAFLLGAIITLAIVMQFSETRKRINDSLFSSWELLDKEKFNYDDPFTGVTLRIITWKFVLQKFVANENLLIGLGTGDARAFINSVYIERDMDHAGYLNYNMHNQYLEYFLKFGLIGVVYFFTILFLCFKRAIKTKNDLYLYFLLIFCLFSLTESTLEVQRGILFFVLVNTVFYFSPSIKKERKECLKKELL